MLKLLAALSLTLSTSVFAADLNVLSWNVFMLPKPVKFSWQKFRTNLIGNELKETDYDVILLQEAFISSFRKSVSKKLKSKYPHSTYLGRNRLVYPILGSGVFVLSKHPFRVLERYHFTVCRGTDCPAAKGALLIELKTPSGKVVQIANTHLQSQEAHGLVRLAQLTEVRDLLHRHRREGVPQLLIGDLNIDASESEFRQGLELMDMDHVELTGPILHTNKLVNDCYKTNSNLLQREWIDHIWVRNANADAATMQVRNFDFEHEGKRCYLSDHHAIEAKLTL